MSWTHFVTFIVLNPDGVLVLHTAFKLLLSIQKQNARPQTHDADEQGTRLFSPSHYSIRRRVHTCPVFRGQSEVFPRRKRRAKGPRKELGRKREGGFFGGWGIGEGKGSWIEGGGWAIGL